MPFPLARAVYRALIGLLPGGFTRRYGPELLRSFEERIVAAPSATRRAAVLARAALDVLVNTWLLWHRDRDRRRLAARLSRPPQRWRFQMQTILADIRFALRAFRRRPGQAALAILTLALGIGASSATFSIVDGVLLRPLPYPDPAELVSVYPTWPEYLNHPTLSELSARGTYSWPEYFAVEEQQTSFSAIAAYGWTSGTVTGAGRPEEVSLGRARWRLFPMLGATPQVGRLFTEEDDPTAGARVILLTDGYWRERFGAESRVVGTTLTVDDEPYTIVGVLPPSFVVGGMESVRGWLPRGNTSTAGNWNNHSSTRAIARLKPGVTAEAAREEVAGILQRSPPPDHVGRHDAAVYPRLADETRSAKPALVALTLASILLLAVSCGNVAALLLGSGIEREYELSVRSALGAPRRRVARQLLTESVVLWFAGAAGGIAFAFGATRMLLSFAPLDLPRLEHVAVNLRALAFTVAVGGGAGILFGLIPALGLSRVSLAETLVSSRGTTGGRPRIQAAVVAGEIALATVLLVSGVLLVRTLWALDHIDPGFRADNLLAVQTAFPWQRFPNGDEGRAAADAYFGGIVSEVDALPGVRAVAVTGIVPLTPGRGNNEIAPKDAEPGTEELAERRFVSANYFRAMQLPIVAGRPFQESDDVSGARLAVILSDGLAKRFWPGESAIGKEVEFWGRSAEVVGVAGDMRDESLDATTSFAFYAPMRQFGALVGALLVRTAGDPAALVPALRERIWSVAPDLPITSVIPMSELMATSLAQQRYRARLMGVAAVLAAVVAGMGIYGVTARSVARRTREMAIRMALGAERGTVMAMVIRQGAVIAAVGASIGVMLSVFSTRLLADLLYGVTAFDPMTLGTIAVLIGLVSVLASLAPSRRATRVDPITALRSE